MDCSNKSIRLGGLNTRHLVFKAPEAGKSEVKAPANLVFEEDLFSGSWTAVFLLCPYISEEKDAPWGLSLSLFFFFFLLFMATPAAY